METRFFFGLTNETVLDKLDEFRKEFEILHGPTDVHNRYTSRLPKVKQEEMLRTEPLVYFDGLPDFVRAFYKEQWHLDASNGKLDDLPNPLLVLYVELNKRAR